MAKIKELKTGGLEQPRRRRRKVLWISLGAALGVPLLLALAAVLYWKLGYLEQRIGTEVSQKLKEKLGPGAGAGAVKLEGLSALYVQNVSVPSADGRPEPVISVGRVSVGWDLNDLVSRTRIRSLVIERPAVDFRCDAAGKWNLSLPEWKPSPGPTPDLGRVELRDGRAAVEWAPGQRGSLTDIQGEVVFPEPDKHNLISLRARLPSESEWQARIDLSPGLALSTWADQDLLRNLSGLLAHPDLQLRAELKGQVDLAKDLGPMLPAFPGLKGLPTLDFGVQYRKGESGPELLAEGELTPKGNVWPLQENLKLVAPEHKWKFGARIPLTRTFAAEDGAAPRRMALPPLEDLHWSSEGLGRFSGRLEFPLSEKPGGPFALRLEKVAGTLSLEAAHGLLEPKPLGRFVQLGGELQVKDLDFRLPLAEDGTGWLLNAELGFPELRVKGQAAGGGLAAAGAVELSGAQVTVLPGGKPDLAARAERLAARELKAAWEGPAGPWTLQGGLDFTKLKFQLPSARGARAGLECDISAPGFDLRVPLLPFAKGLVPADTWSAVEKLARELAPGGEKPDEQLKAQGDAQLRNLKLQAELTGDPKTLALEADLAVKNLVLTPPLFKQALPPVELNGRVRVADQCAELSNALVALGGLSRMVFSAQADWKDGRLDWTRLLGKLRIHELLLDFDRLQDSPAGRMATNYWDLRGRICGEELSVAVRNEGEVTVLALSGVRLENLEIAKLRAPGGFTLALPGVKFSGAVSATAKLKRDQLAELRLEGSLRTAHAEPLAARFAAVLGADEKGAFDLRTVEIAEVSLPLRETLKSAGLDGVLSFLDLEGKAKVQSAVYDHAAQSLTASLALENVSFRLPYSRPDWPADSLHQVSGSLKAQWRNQSVSLAGKFGRCVGRKAGKETPLPGAVLELAVDLTPGGFPAGQELALPLLARKVKASLLPRSVKLNLTADSGRTLKVLAEVAPASDRRDAWRAAARVESNFLMPLRVNCDVVCPFSPGPLGPATLSVDAPELGLRGGGTLDKARLEPPAAEGGDWKFAGELRNFAFEHLGADLALARLTGRFAGAFSSDPQTGRYRVSGLEAALENYEALAGNFHLPPPAKGELLELKTQLEVQVSPGGKLRVSLGDLSLAAGGILKAQAAGEVALDTASEGLGAGRLKVRLAAPRIPAAVTALVVPNLRNLKPQAAQTLETLKLAGAAAFDGEAKWDGPRMSLRGDLALDNLALDRGQAKPARLDAKLPVRLCMGEWPKEWPREGEGFFKLAEFQEGLLRVPAQQLKFQAEPNGFMLEPLTLHFSVGTLKLANAAGADLLGANGVVQFHLLAENFALDRVLADLGAGDYLPPKEPLPNQFVLGGKLECLMVRKPGRKMVWDLTSEGKFAVEWWDGGQLNLGPFSVRGLGGDTPVLAGYLHWERLTTLKWFRQLWKEENEGLGRLKSMFDLRLEFKTTGFQPLDLQSFSFHVTNLLRKGQDSHVNGQFLFSVVPAVAQEAMKVLFWQSEETFRKQAFLFSRLSMSFHLSDGKFIGPVGNLMSKDLDEKGNPKRYMITGRNLRTLFTKGGKKPVPMDIEAPKENERSWRELLEKALPPEMKTRMRSPLEEVQQRLAARRPELDKFRSLGALVETKEGLAFRPLSNQDLETRKLCKDLLAAEKADRLLVTRLEEAARADSTKPLDVSGEEEPPEDKK